MNTQRFNYYRLFYIIALGLLPKLSFASDNFIEISQSVNSDTLDKVQLVGLYGYVEHNHDANVYAGIQVASYDAATTLDTGSTALIIFGVERPAPISPFAEIGTDLLGLLVHEDEDEICNSENSCEIDFYFRIGLRAPLSQQLSLGIYHQRIVFGDFHSELEGGHSFTGVSLGMYF